MSKHQKRIARIMNNPRAVRFEDLDGVLRRAGFEARQEGSHVTYVKGGVVTGVVKPHGGRIFVAVVYVESALEALRLAALDEEEEEDGDEEEE